MSGAPASLAALVSTVYAGGDLTHTSSPTAAAALKARKPTTGPVTATAKVGSWMGTPVAVVTAGQDVTLAVGPTWKVVGGWWPSLGVATPSLGKGGPRWVLGIGSDARPGEDLSHTRADSLQVVGSTGAGAAASWAWPATRGFRSPTGGKGKINSAMVFGGPQAELETVRSATGLPIEGYVVIGFTGFTQVVDEQGGIPIVVPQTVNASHAGIIIKAGPQTPHRHPGPRLRARAPHAARRRLRTLTPPG